jgi:nucleoid-associated protein YgaU
MQTYVVRPGDTLWDIAARTYGNGSDYVLILHANPGLTNHITPGDHIVLPAKPSSRDELPSSE